MCDLEAIGAPCILRLIRSAAAYKHNRILIECVFMYRGKKGESQVFIFSESCNFFLGFDFGVGLPGTIKFSITAIAVIENFGHIGESKT